MGKTAKTRIEKCSVKDVFTPTKPARLTFVERESLNEKLVNALTTPGKQLVVYGHSGSGKTTLLVNKLHQLYENHLTTRCVSHFTFETVVLNAFDQLDPYFTSESSTSKNKEISTSMKAEYLGLKSQVGAHLATQVKTTVKRFLPPQLTPQTLARLLGHAHLCWVLEDFHKLPDSEKKKLAQVMKVFMDMADEYPELKIVALGAVDTARQVVEYDPEMWNRVAEIHVPLMTEDEIQQIIRTGEKLLNFSLPTSARKGIVSYANGLASVCHHLCLNICNAAGIIETQPKAMSVKEVTLTKAVEQYLAEASDTLKRTFDSAFRKEKAMKFDNCRLIIKALAECPQEGASHIELLEKVRKEAQNYPAANLTTFLKELQTPERGSLLRFDPTSGRFSFADPIFRTFALATFKKERMAGPQEFVFELRWNPEESEDLVKELVEELTTNLKNHSAQYSRLKPMK